MAKDGLFEELSLVNKKLQINHLIDGGLQRENLRKLILTSIEFVKENSQDIKTLIKNLHYFIHRRLRRIRI